MKLTLKIWRQKSQQQAGELKTYTLNDLNSHMSFFGDVRYFKRATHLGQRRPGYV